MTKISKINFPTRICLFSGILLLGIFLRLLGSYMEPRVERDAIRYIQLTECWFKTGDFRQVQILAQKFQSVALPFYFYLSSRVMFLGVSAEDACWITSFICGILTIIVCYFLCHALQFDDPRIDLMFMACIAVHPFLVELSRRMIRDGTAFFFACCCCCCCFISFKKRMPWISLFAGIFYGMLILTRYEYWELFPIFIAFLAFCFLTKQLSSKQIFLYLFYCLIGFSISFVGWSFVMGGGGYIISKYKQEFLIHLFLT